MSPKKRDTALRLPPLELQCLQALWALGEGTVQQLRAHLLSVRPLAYTTVMTVMDRLVRKDMVSRKKRGRAHLYRPQKALEDFRQNAVIQLVKDFFGGSQDALAQYLRDGTPPAAPSPRTLAPSPHDRAAGAAKGVVTTAAPRHAKPRRMVSANPSQEPQAELATGLAPELL